MRAVERVVSLDLMRSLDFPSVELARDSLDGLEETKRLAQRSKGRRGAFAHHLVKTDSLAEPSENLRRAVDEVDGVAVEAPLGELQNVGMRKKATGTAMWTNLLGGELPGIVGERLPRSEVGTVDAQGLRPVVELAHHEIVVLLTLKDERLRTARVSIVLARAKAMQTYPHRTGMDRSLGKVDELLVLRRDRKPHRLVDLAFE